MQASNYISAVLAILTQHAHPMNEGAPFTISDCQYDIDGLKEAALECGDDEASRAYIATHIAIHGWECVRLLDVDGGEATMGAILVLYEEDGEIHKVYYQVCCPDVPEVERAPMGKVVQTPEGPRWIYDIQG